MILWLGGKGGGITAGIQESGAGTSKGECAEGGDYQESGAVGEGERDKGSYRIYAEVREALYWEIRSWGYE